MTGSRRSRRARALCAVAAAVVAALGTGGAAAQAAAPVFEKSFNGSATPAGKMFPNRLAVNETTGSVYVIDEGDKGVVDVFSASGAYQIQLLATATPSGSFDFGSGEDDIAVDNSSAATKGNVYVLGENAGGPGEITAFDASGKFLWQTTAPPGSDVCGIAVDHAGGLWTADYGFGVQQRVTTGLTAGSTIGSPIVIPGGDCHLAFAPDATGDFFMILYDTGSLHEYNASGTEIGPNPIDPKKDSAVAVDSFNGDVYVVHQPTSIMRFSSTGTAIGTFGSELTGALGIAVNGVNHKIYVGDSLSQQIFIYNEVNPVTLTVTPAGAGSGTVSADSGAISGCSSAGGTCTDTYNSFATAPTLTATPTPGTHSAFAGWSGGGCSGTAPTCQPTLNGDTTVTATFNPIPQRTLAVTKAGSGSGSVSDGGALTCGATCSNVYDDGTAVTLTATPAAHSTFTGWSGSGCSGTSPTCKLTLGADAAVTATFAHDLPAVAGEAASAITQTAATLAGTVNPNGAATTCQIEWGTTTTYGTAVPCTTNPGSGTEPVAVTIPALSGLTAGTTYHYRIDATNVGGTTNGTDHTFTTSAPTCATDASLCPKPAPTCATDALLCPKPTPSCATDASLCPPPPPALPTLPHAARVTGTNATIALTCPAGGGTCSGTVTLTARIVVRKGKRTVVKTIVVGRLAYDLAAGGSEAVKLKLSSAASAALAHGGLTVTAKGLSGSIRLTKAGQSKRSKRH
jgi:hypothetical protein